MSTYKLNVKQTTHIQTVLFHKGVNIQDVIKRCIGIKRQYTTDHLSSSCYMQSLKYNNIYMALEGWNLDTRYCHFSWFAIFRYLILHIWNIDRYFIEMKFRYLIFYAKLWPFWEAIIKNSGLAAHYIYKYYKYMNHQRHCFLKSPKHKKIFLYINIIVNVSSS